MACKIEIEFGWKQKINRENWLKWYSMSTSLDTKLWLEVDTTNFSTFKLANIKGLLVIEQKWSFLFLSILTMNTFQAICSSEYLYEGNGELWDLCRNLKLRPELTHKPSRYIKQILATLGQRWIPNTQEGSALTGTPSMHACLCSSVSNPWYFLQ